MECCGKERKTLFCSDCGAKLAVNLRQELVVYLVGRRNILQGAKMRQLKWAEANPTAASASRYHRLKGPRLQKQIERFESWIACVDNMVVADIKEEENIR